MSVDNSQEQYEALVQAQRQGFLRVVLAIICFVGVWKISILIGTKIWGGGALSTVLGILFPYVYDWRSYELTKKFSPLVGATFSFLMIDVQIIIFTIAIYLLDIPQ